ncbi:mechanosensitive ion channel family protein [Alistipes sp.]|uniref:mechanosensitive ion channel family protein n=1 Tax=Alistipes sp. TaxID=1872444 RepID=UPI003AEF26D7
MQTFLKKWTDALLDWLGATSAQHDGWDRWVALALAVVLVVLFDFVSRLILVRGVRRLVQRTRARWDDELFSTDVLNRLCHILSAVLLAFILPVVFEEASTAREVVMRLMEVYVVITVLRFVNALLSAAFRIASDRPAWQNKPIKGLRQTAQGIALIISVILIVSILIDKSPTILLTGLGASAALIILIFRDSILGFVSGIQLSANDMLQVGDWISVPKYGADGNVIEVSLTTVKIRNFDNTVVMLPPYILVSESFQNWRAMQLSGGRRVMRSVAIDMTSVQFCTSDMLDRYRTIDLIKDYIDQTEKRVETYNTAHGIAAAERRINGLHQTNLGVFRAYLVRYLQNEVPVNKQMTLMVRQLQPTETGLPMQLYFFTNTVDWIAYEGIQSDVFDHVLAIIPEFDLRVFQNPTGSDLEALRRPDVSLKEDHQHDLNDDHAQEHADGVDRGV